MEKELEDLLCSKNINSRIGFIKYTGAEEDINLRKKLVPATYINTFKRYTNGDRNALGEVMKMFHLTLAQGYIMFYVLDNVRKEHWRPLDFDLSTDTETDEVKLTLWDGDFDPSYQGKWYREDPKVKGHNCNISIIIKPNGDITFDSYKGKTNKLKKYIGKSTTFKKSDKVLKSMKATVCGGQYKNEMANIYESNIKGFEVLK